MARVQVEGVDLADKIGVYPGDSDTQDWPCMSKWALLSEPLSSVTRTLP